MFCSRPDITVIAVWVLKNPVTYLASPRLRFGSPSSISASECKVEKVINPPPAEVLSSSVSLSADAGHETDSTKLVWSSDVRRSAGVIQE